MTAAEGPKAASSARPAICPANRLAEASASRAPCRLRLRTSALRAARASLLSRLSTWSNMSGTTADSGTSTLAGCAGARETLTISPRASTSAKPGPTALTGISRTTLSALCRLTSDRNRSLEVSRLCTMPSRVLSSGWSSVSRSHLVMTKLIGAVASIITGSSALSVRSRYSGPAGCPSRCCLIRYPSITPISASAESIWANSSFCLVEPASWISVSSSPAYSRYFRRRIVSAVPAMWVFTVKVNCRLSPLAVPRGQSPEAAVSTIWAYHWLSSSTSSCGAVRK